jgi:hypothetical protein
LHKKRAPTRRLAPPEGKRSRLRNACNGACYAPANEGYKWSREPPQGWIMGIGPGLSRCDPGTLFWTVFTTFAERKFSLAIRETAALFAGR